MSLTQKDATLNAQTTSQNGASIHHNSNTVTISNTDYHINVNAQEEDYDLKLSLNNKWSFRNSAISTITLTLNGETPHPDKDTDFLIVFSVNDKQYFSFFAHLDFTNNIKCRIYGSISLENITRSVSDILSDNTIHARWDRISNNNQWLIISNGFNKQAIWPLKFIIINNPMNNQIIFEFYNEITQTYATQYIFENVFFMPNTPIDIFVMGDSNGEQFIVSSLNIQLSYNQSTTTIPSISPTEIPSKIPSNFQTQIPTNFPTESDNIILSIQYRIIITITFGYKLSINDTYKIVSVLNDITNKIINKTCLNSTNKIIKQKNPNDVTIINATIFACNLTEIINVSTNDNFEQQFLQNINQQTELDIIKNKTNIEIIITEYKSNNIINNNKTIPITTNYFIQTNENNKQNDIIGSGTKTELIIFIKIIGLQLILCCLMSICVFTLKYRTKRLKNKRVQISQKVNKIIRNNKSQNISVNDNESVTNECNDDRISNLHLSGKRKLKFMKLKSNTNTNHQSYYHSQITKQLHNTQQISDENLCILSILQCEGNKHIPQESDTITRQTRQILLQKQHVALQQLKSRHQIISGISTDDLPSIPNTTRNYTQTFTIDEITKSTILSPTFTYKINGRQRGVV